MRRVIVSNFMSLDGFFAGPGGELNWFVWDDEMAEYVKAQFTEIDTLLFGRKTYQLMADYWPAAKPPEEDPVIIEAMNSLPKIVFSSTLNRAEWRNSRVVGGHIDEEVAGLKKQAGRDMVIFGSGTIVSAFTRSGLIDEYRIFVNPVVLGRGRPMFTGLERAHKLKLLGTRTFQCGNVLLRYRPDNG
ncbi:MAG: dihydrofolate reductase family protein [Desulfobulbaceae bacterium]|jgi:dihydrofolate reductase|nr:dihydrofolate reductase family protein [Desulfobulbaceae bacterium]MDY0351736.1 dihydrofolate reductase family protein [Desulfobulbaceae bacterium]